MALGRGLWCGFSGFGFDFGRSGRIGGTFSLSEVASLIEVPEERFLELLMLGIGDFFELFFRFVVFPRENGDPCVMQEDALAFGVV